MKKILILILIFINNTCFAEEIVNINSLRIWPSPEGTRIVFDLSNKVNYKIHNLLDPVRIVVDFNDAQLNKKLVDDLKKAPRLAKIKQMRTSSQKNMARVVFELDEQLKVNDFTLNPNERYGHRLILDLESNEKQEILALFDLSKSEPKLENKPEPQQNKLTNKLENGLQKLEPKPIAKILPITKELIIAIDAGHGGEDPGAIGYYGTEEKVVALEIAKGLAQEINSKKNMKAFLIRNGDYYVSLRERRLRARKYNADLFISIHADAVSNKQADGASVFILSEKGASSAAARWLAESENRSDTLGGVRIDRTENILSSVLLDLSQTKNKEASFDAAKSILYSMQKTVPLHKDGVERAGFAVLKAPDVPSILIETGFISNPRTELKLKTKSYQQRIVSSILDGIERYFLSRPKKAQR